MTEEETALTAILELCNALEAWSAQTKRAIAHAKQIPTPTDQPLINDVRRSFPDNLARLLKFEPFENHMKITPTRFLGSDNFGKIADVVRGLGGRYVSAGKNSHFEVPLTTPGVTANGT